MAIAGSGDKLAGGAAKASFGMPNISKEKWDAIWSDEKDSSNANTEAPGVSSISTSEPRTES